MLPQKRLLKHVIYERLRSRIVLGQIPLGSKISARNLANDFGVSLSPVRDAIHQLVQEGLLTVISQSGTYVIQIDKADIAAILEHRVAIESTCILLSSKHNHALFTQKLSTFIEQMDQTRKQKNWPSYFQFDNQFHSTIVNLSENSYLIKSYELSRAKMELLNCNMGASVEYVENCFDEHALLTQQIIDKSYDKAIETLKKHLDINENLYFLKNKSKKPLSHST